MLNQRGISMSKLGLLSGILMSTTLLTSTVGLAQDQITKIGILAPITGGAAADGEEMVNGARLAVDEINANGGIAGYRLELVVGDTQDQAADSVTSAFERLIGDRQLHGFVTGYASGSNFEIELMAEQDMPYIISANSD